MCDAVNPTLSHAADLSDFRRQHSKHQDKGRKVAYFYDVPVLGSTGTFSLITGQKNVKIKGTTCLLAQKSRN
jgi:hypothetical protein